jgi:hypothetical protein
MTPAKIFKVKGIKDKGIFTVFLQMLSDSYVAIIATFITFIICFFYLNFLPNYMTGGIVTFVAFVSYTLVKTEIGGKKLYYYFPKYLLHVYKPKKLDKLSEIEFKLIGLEGQGERFALFNNRIVSYYELTPVDYMLMDKDARATFENQFARFINNIRDNRIQIIVQNREATESDYMKHFDSVDKQMVSFKSKTVQDRREKHLEAYKSNLKGLLKEGIIPIRKYYILFQKFVDPTSVKSIDKSLVQLVDTSNRICRNLNKADIQTKVLEGDKLGSFLIEFNQKI